MDIKEQRDALIREKLSSDKVILEPSLNIKNNYLNETKVKQKKYTRKQKKLLFFVIILLIISCFFNIYLLKKPNAPLAPISKNNTIINENLDIVDTLENNNTYFSQNEIIQESTNDIVNSNSLSNNTTINATTKDMLESSEFSSEEFKKILELYSLGIHRIYEANNNETEKNTIKLLITLRYLDYCSQNNKVSSAKYAFLKDNVYLCLNELTKTNYPVDILSTYEDFVKYTTFSNSFLYGDDSSILTNEKYEILELKPYEGSNGNYNIETRIKRIVKYNDDITNEDIFKVKFVVSINSNYTYSKYKIEAMYFENENKSAPNTTYRLTDTSMFTDDDLKNIKDEILHQYSNDEVSQIYLDKIEKTSKNTYTISYRLIINNVLKENTLTVNKEDSKLNFN